MLFDGFLVNMISDSSRVKGGAELGPPVGLPLSLHALTDKPRPTIILMK